MIALSVDDRAGTRPFGTTVTLNPSPTACGSRSVAETVTVCVPPPAGIVAGDDVLETSTPGARPLTSAWALPALPFRSASENTAYCWRSAPVAESGNVTGGVNVCELRSTEIVGPRRTAER